MKYQALCLLPILIAGSTCMTIPGLGTVILDEITKEVEPIIAPAEDIENEIITAYTEVSQNPLKLLSFDPDECMKLSNSTDKGLTLVKETYSYAAASAQEIAESLNAAVSCSDLGVLDGLNCLFAHIKAIKAQILEIEKGSEPIVDGYKALCTETLSEMHKCLGF